MPLKEDQVQSSSDFNAGIETLIIASALILYKTSAYIRYPVLDHSYWKSNLLHSPVFFFVFPNICSPVGKRKYAKVIYVARVRYIFSSLYCGPLGASACVVYICIWHACVCMYMMCARASAQESRWETEVKGERTTSRVPKASTFCYAIARSWRRDSIKLRTRHHGRPINPQTKVDYDFSRGHRSRLLLRPVHTHERVHRFFWRDVYIGRIWISSGPLRVITSCFSCLLRDFFSPLSGFFYSFCFERNINGELFATDEISTLTSLILLLLLFFLVNASAFTILSFISSLNFYCPLHRLCMTHLKLYRCSI